MTAWMPRQPEPEAMDIPEEAHAYADADFAEVNAAFVERLLELAGGCAHACALDLGTGPGDIPLRLIRQRPEWRVVAVDVSRPMLLHARSTAATEAVSLGLVQVDAKALPFASKAFNIVFSNSILHHLPETGAFWEHVKRVSAPGAHILIRDLARPQTPEAAAGIVRQYASQESLLLQQEFYRSLLAAFTVDEVRLQLDQHGLASLHVEMVSGRHLDISGTLA